MGINSAKSWSAVDISGKLVFFTDYINVKKGHSVVFFILYSKSSLDVDFLFTNITLEETIENCANELFKESEMPEGLSKTEFKELLFLATKDSHFIFDGTFYKQNNGVAMGSHLGPTLANAFLAYHEKNWLEHFPLEYRPLYYRRYVDDVFVLFNSA